MQIAHADRYDLVGRRLWWFGLSLATAVAGMVAWGVHGLNKGIDFKGGSLLKFEAAEPVFRHGEAGAGDLATVYQAMRGILEQEGIEGSRVEVTRDGRLILIRTTAQTAEEAEKQVSAVGAALEKQFNTTTTRTRDFVGPVIGKELGIKAIKAFILGILLIMIYVSWRYEFRFAVAAIVALIHDVTIIVGVFALTKREVDSSFVPVILTVVGYSVHDTIVIFDRIRENMRLYRREPFDLVVNASLWQTMARSINTVLTVVITLMALLFFGGPTINVFSFGLLIGITCGAYSSIFVASPIVVAWRQFDERRRAAAAAVPLRPSSAPRPRPRREPTPRLGPGEAATVAEGVGSGADGPSASADVSELPAEETTGDRAPKKKRAGRTRRRRF